MDLTKDDAIKYLETILQLKVSSDLIPSLSLLNNIILATHENIPFQNLTLMAKNVKDRRRPNLLEVKASMFKKHGGLCYQMNMFLYHLLESLGYSVTLAHSTVTFFPNDISHNGHLLVYVHDVVNKGDLFLADVGLSFATFEAVDMKFENESKIYYHSRANFKYTRRNGQGVMLYRDVDSQLDWKELCVFDLTGTKNVQSFEPIYDDIYSKPEFSIFHTIIRVIAFPHQRQFSITNNTLKTEDENGDISIVKLTNDDEHVTVIKKYFPQFSEDILRQALDNWHLYRREQTRTT